VREHGGREAGQVKVSTREPLPYPRREYQDRVAVLALLAFVLGIIVGVNL
jgi:hypothetical protein